MTEARRQERKPFLMPRFWGYCDYSAGAALIPMLPS